MIFERYPYPADIPPAEKLGLLMMGYRMTQLVYVAAELGIADQLWEGPKSAAELALLVGADREYLFRIMRALVSIGVFDQNENEEYLLNPLSEFLCQRVEGSLHKIAIRHGAEWTWLPWGELIHAVRTGTPAFDHAFGRSHWEYLAGHPDVNEGFSCSMAESAALITSAVLRQYEFSEIGTIIDVGGGYGSLLAGILKAYPTTLGVLFDQAEVVSRAGETLTHQGVINRCECISGDFFTAVPSGGDVYILQRIIHDWNDAKALQILKNCRKAMGNSGKLLIVDRIMPGTSAPSPVKIVDITVMVLYGGGRERTELEFRDLLAQANIRISRMIPLQTESSMIETAGYFLMEGLPI
jgi:hypothetical protein